MSFAIVTPSYSNDLPLFEDLHRSVLRHADEQARHYVVVPGRDVGLFAPLAGPRCTVVPEESLYPAHYLPAGRVNEALRFVPRVPAHVRLAALDARHLFRPIRGWIMQQALKLEMCRQLGEQVVLLLDSDVELVRPVTEDVLRRGPRARLYRRPGEVDGRLPLHMRWHDVSRRLLGLPPARFPAPDYVSSFCVWEPAVVRAMLERIEEVSGQPWMDVITGQRSCSEWTLYGVFAEEILKYSADAVSDLSLCHSYWGTLPLDLERATEFIAGIGPDDVAVLIQSKAGTPWEVRRAVIASFDSSAVSRA